MRLKRKSFLVRYAWLGASEKIPYESTTCEIGGRVIGRTLGILYLAFMACVLIYEIGKHWNVFLQVLAVIAAITIIVLFLVGAKKVATSAALSPTRKVISDWKNRYCHKVEIIW